MDEVKSREQLLYAYIAGRGGVVELRMSFDEEQLEALMAQETLSELIVFLDSHAVPVLTIKRRNTQSCAGDGPEEKLDCFLEK